MNKKRFGLILSSIIYTLVLFFSYENVISPYFSYIGYKYHEYELFWLIAFFVVTVIPSLWLPIHVKRPSQILYWFLYIFVVVPIGIVPFLAGIKEYNKLLLFLVYIVTIFFCLRFVWEIELKTFKLPEIPSLIFWSVFLFVCIIFFVFIVSFFGFEIQYVSFREVYDVREAYRESYLFSHNNFIAYIIGWQANAMNPFLIAYGLREKKIPLLGFGVFFQAFIYSITGFKSVIMSPLIIIIVFICIKFHKRNFGLAIMFFTISMVSLVTFIDLRNNSIILSSLFVRRLIMTPGLLSGYYFDFFSSQPKVMLSNSILKWFMVYPYDFSPPRMIGLVYMGNYLTSANANLWADAFAHFGYIGIFVFTVILGVLMWLYDSLVRDDDLILSSMTIVVPSIVLTNSGLLTSLLTHGFGAVYVLLFCMPRKVK